MAGISFRKIKLFLFLFVALYSLSYGSVFADVFGQTTIFNIDSQYDYLSRTKVSATLMKISEKAYWYVSDDYWVSLSDQEKSIYLNKLDGFAREFETRIYPTETQFWGSEWNPGIDNDPKITVLLTRLIDQAGGYFDTSHEYERTRAPDSNQREMIFVNASSLASDKTGIFLAHELNHLISFYQKEKLKGPTDEIWLSEARAEWSVELAGYNSVFETSNLRRRVSAFIRSPSEPLGEWKNEASDYGSTTLFTHYLVEHYGSKILLDSLRSSKTGIESINEALKLNGFTDTFSDIFINWTVASFLNDPSLGSKFSYQNTNLRDLRISPTQSYTISGSGGTINISNFVKDWQPVWYEFNTPVGSNSNLRVNFVGSPDSRFRIPYIVFKANGEKETGVLPFNSNSVTLFVRNFGSEVYKVVLIPANQSKTSGFTANDPGTPFSLQAQLVSEIPEDLMTSTPTPMPSTSQSIQAILDQIKSLQEQIARLQGQQTGTPFIFPLNRDLFVGSQGDDVKWLQEFLIKENVYPEAKITGYFGQLTKSATIRFQQKYGIFPQMGYVGQKTRAKISELINQTK